MSLLNLFGSPKGILPEKPHYCIFLWDPQAHSWKNHNPDGCSARRCKKARAMFLEMGYLDKYIKIFPKGIEPPPLKEA